MPQQYKFDEALRRVENSLYKDASGEITHPWNDLILVNLRVETPSTLDEDD